MISMLLLLTACKAPPEAPAELEELSRYLYREWDNEDPAVMEAGVVNLRDFLATVDLEGGILDRSFEVGPPEESDISDVDRPPGRSAADLLGVSVGYLSEWPVADHAKLQTEADQLPAEPSAKIYERTISERGCFIDRECVLVTENDIRRENLLMAVSMVLFKDFRWVEIDGEQALIARSWTAEVFEGDGGDTAVFQSHSLDTWLPAGNDTWRYQLVWSEADAGVSSEGLILGTLKNATNDIFKAGDKAIEEQYH